MISKMKKYILIAGLVLLAMPLLPQKTENSPKGKEKSVLSYIPDEMNIVVSIEVKGGYVYCVGRLTRIHNSVVNKLLAIGIDRNKIKSDGTRISEYVGEQTINIVEKYSKEQLAKIVNVLADTLYSPNAIPFFYTDTIPFSYTDNFRFFYTIRFQLSENQINEALKLVKSQIITDTTNAQYVEIKNIKFSGDTLVYHSGTDSGQKINPIDLTPTPIEITIVWKIKSGKKKN